MSIDNGYHISDINPKLPADDDPRAEGAQQICALKRAIQRTFKWTKGEDNKRPDLPVGYISMYYGKEENLTKGWAICDGRTVNGVLTPDLRGKFIMGVNDEFANAKTGGVHKVSLKSTADFKLEIAHIPSHNHVVHNGSLGYDQTGWVSGDNRQCGPDIKHWSNLYPTTHHTGGGQAHKHDIADFDNRPEFMALSYIMFVGMYED
ncbi:hypothetical protein [Enterovibrio baiacu]|uniref:hypothetical protein n=1 Tax=Enterovibrio baiacu TaxID=2491023 RepID=UPI0010128983|nr:hypothetical protein [Enterovibrio baiacu]MBE1275088.1 hypothetical protein [Enterovibrio baiacu]